MVPVSVVIITKNEAALIEDCIKMARLITDDIVVVDNDSTDGTPLIASGYGCRVFQKSWAGYGANKNKGIALSRYNWILSIDADEVPDADLVKALHHLNFDKANVVYDIKFKSYFGKKLIRFGNWGNDHHLRLFNRSLVKWGETEVHETLLLPPDAEIKSIAGHIHHHSVTDIEDFKRKAILYAQLSAAKYYKAGKKATFIKLHFSPAFGFLRNYIIRLGFLDGAEGLAIARVIYKNTRLKYVYLKRYKEQPRKQNDYRNELVMEQA
ncbi:glycosyltransferase family 2 protein [Mucilaginibacter kameinonensis]|uniref:glycosyltransferase family 2 protein n=1 Tax=Mucilaginibacter kameinonensis TaxID=452286 RepID=UPI000EF77B01|nr:glycosyltransferase family 2 protein [Mucilaginibacter kameinonensis]